MMKKLLLILGLGLFSVTGITKDITAFTDTFYYLNEKKEEWNSNGKRIRDALRFVSASTEFSEEDKVDFVVETLGLSLSAIEKRKQKTALLDRFKEAAAQKISILKDTEYFIVPYSSKARDYLGLSFFPNEVKAGSGFHDNDFFKFYDIEKGRLYSDWEENGTDWACSHFFPFGDWGIPIFAVQRPCGKAYIDMPNDIAQELILDRKKPYTIVTTVKLKNEEELVPIKRDILVKTSLVGATVHFVTTDWEYFRKNGKSFYSAELKFE